MLYYRAALTKGKYVGVGGTGEKPYKREPIIVGQTREVVN
jgi:hypothetical protein